MIPKKILLVVGLFVVLFVLLFGILSSRPPATTTPTYGYATIMIQLPDAQGLNATLNGQQFSLTALTATYKLGVGNQELQITKPGYKPFSVNFAVSSGEKLIIDVTPQSAAPQAPVVATEQVGQSFVGFLPQGFTVQQAVYFYSNTWVVATVSADGGDTAVIVAKYVGGSSPWQTVLGPGTLFFQSDLTGLPSDVVTYMTQQHYALGGD